MKTNNVNPVSFSGLQIVKGTSKQIAELHKIYKNQAYIHFDTGYGMQPTYEVFPYGWKVLKANPKKDVNVCQFSTGKDVLELESAAKTVSTQKPINASTILKQIAENRFNFIKFSN